MSTPPKPTRPPIILPPKIRLTRQRRIPPGFVVGRLSGLHGDEALISIGQLWASITSTPGAATKLANAGVAGFGFSILGFPSANQLIGSGVFGSNVIFPSAAKTSVVNAETAAAASAVFNIVVGGVTVGTITFALGSFVGVVAWTGGTYTMNAGTTFYLYAPSPADTNLSYITGTVYGDVA